MNIRGFIATVLIASVLPFAADAFVVGGNYPPTGKIDGADTVVALPDEQPQTAMTEDECVASGEDCSGDYDWYVKTDYKLGYNIPLDVKYVHQETGDTVAEAETKIWHDGNAGNYNSVKYVSPTIAGFTLSSSWGEEDDYDVALRYAGEFGAIRVASGDALNHYHDAYIDNYTADPGSAYNAASNTFQSSPNGIGPIGSNPGNYWSGDDSSTAVEDVPQNEWSIGADYKWRGDLSLELKYSTDGWYGRSQGITEDVDTGVYVAPTIQRPNFDAYLRGGLDAFIPYNSGLFIPTETFQIPADDGGGFIGSFVPAVPEQSYEGLNIISRYRLNDNFTLQGNYSYYDPASDLVQQVPANNFTGFDPAFVQNNPTFTHIVIVMKIGGCRIELEKRRKTRAKSHIRATPPSAADFVANPDEPRQHWNARYDGALPVVMDSSSSRKVMSEALTAFLNQPYLWFAPSDAAILLGEDSAVGQGGGGGGGGAPSVAIADDECNGSTTVIKGGGGPSVVQDAGQGTTTTPVDNRVSTTKDGDEPCDCSKEAADVAEGRAWLTQMEAAFVEAQAAYDALQGPMAASQAEQDRIVAERDAAIDRGDDAGRIAGNDAYYAHLGGWNRLREQVREAERALSDAAIARNEAKDALKAAEQALAACQARCGQGGTTTGQPGGGTGTGTGPSGPAVPTGPQGPATTTGQPDEPCDCTALQAAYDAALRAKQEAERTMTDAFAAEDRARVLENSASETVRDMRGASQRARNRAAQEYQEARQARAAAQQAATAASRAFDEANSALNAAKRALDACNARCGQGGAGTGDGPTGPAIPTGPQGPATTTGQPGEPCDCSAEEAALAEATAAREAAEAEDARLRAQLGRLQAELARAQEIGAVQLQRYNRQRNNLDRMDRAIASGQTEYQQAADGLRIRNGLLVEAMRTNDQDISRLQGEIRELEGRIVAVGLPLALRTESQAREALDACNARCR